MNPQDAELSQSRGKPGLPELSGWWTLSDPTQSESSFWAAKGPRAELVSLGESFHRFNVCLILQRRHRGTPRACTAPWCERRRKSLPARYSPQRRWRKQPLDRPAQSEAQPPPPPSHPHPPPPLPILSSLTFIPPLGCALTREQPVPPLTTVLAPRGLAEITANLSIFLD